MWQCDSTKTRSTCLYWNTTDFEKIDNIGPVDERYVASEKTLLVKSAVLYPLSNISAVLSVNQKFNQLTASVVSAQNVVQ